jgi:hypothetical protein
MTRATIWGSVAALAIAAAGLLWFLATFEPVAVRRREAPQAQARRDPYLALDRFLARMGRPLRRAEQAETLERLDGPGVLVLDRRRASHLTPARMQRVWMWVAGGGYLIVVPERADEPDPIIGVLGLDRAERDGAAPSADGPSASSREVLMPGAPRPLAVAAFPGFTPGFIVPVWSGGRSTDGRTQVLHFERGQGAVTVVDGLDVMTSNAFIADMDHAELVWRLIERYQPAGPVTLLTRLETTTLFGWLADHARAGLLAGGVALLLWLWHIGPRFGSVLPAPAADRRQLHEHLRAVGRFVWKQGGSGAWLPVIRGAVMDRLAKRWPALPGGGDGSRILAEHTGLAASEIDLALRVAPHDSDQFVRAARALQQLERRL